VLGLLAAVTGGAAMFAVVLPRAPDLWISPRIAWTIRAADPTAARPLAAAHYHEDSLVFLTRGRAQRIGLASAGDWVRANPDGLLVVPVDRLEELEASAGTTLRPVGHARGFNYSKARWVELVLVERGPRGPNPPGL
jgi:hypothetical protein